MSDPRSDDPYGYFSSPTPPAPAPASAPWGAPMTTPASYPGTGAPSAGYLDPQERQLLAGAQLTAERNMGAAPSFHPLGTRLGIWEAIGAGFRLLPTCWSVLMSDPTMLLVPLAVLVVGLAAATGYIVAFGGISHLLVGGHTAIAIKTLPLTIVLCVVSVIGRAVVVADATQRLQGSRPQMAKAWALTVSHLPALIGFGVAQAAERALTSALRNSPVGRVVGNVADRAWDFATFLAVPSILFEGVGPLASVRRSGSLVASRWGTQLTARSVLSFAIGACTFPLVVLAFVVASVNPIAGVGLLVVIVLTAIAVSSALNGILSAAMYRFATTGLLAPGFAESDMWSAFARR